MRKRERASLYKRERLGESNETDERLFGAAAGQPTRQSDADSEPRTMVPLSPCIERRSECARAQADLREEAKKNKKNTVFTANAP